MHPNNTKIYDLTIKRKRYVYKSKEKIISMFHLAPIRPTPATIIRRVNNVTILLTGPLQIGIKVERSTLKYSATLHCKRICQIVAYFGKKSLQMVLGI